MLYYVMMEFMEQFLGNRGMIEDIYGQSGLNSIIFKQQELKLFYLGQENYLFRGELFDILQIWIALILKYIKQAQAKPPPAPLPRSRAGSRRGVTPRGANK